jgi:hypothetical protein
MKRVHNEVDRRAEEYLAELTDAAYRVALRHGLKGAFVDVELELWRALRHVVRAHTPKGQREEAVCPSAPRRDPEETQEALVCLSGETESWQA